MNQPTIIFKKLYIKNFMCFNEIEFDFITHSGLNLITGKNNDIPNVRNGSGKSTLLSAFYYSLYGKTIKALNTESIVNRCNPDETVTLKVYFSIGDNEYVIISTIERGKTTQCKLFENDNNITKSSLKDTRAYIENDILKIPSNTFLRTIILTKENSKNFFGISKAEKKKFIEELFDLTSFGKMYETIHRDHLNLNSDIKSNEKQLSLIDSTLSDLQNSQNVFDQNTTEKIDACNAQIAHAMDQLNTILNISTDISGAISALTDTKSTLTTQYNKLDAKIDDLNIQIRIQTQNIEHNVKHVKKYEALLKLMCKSCIDKISDEFSLQTSLDNINQCKTNIQNLKANIVKLRTAIDKLSPKIDEIDSKFESINKIKEEITKNKNLLSTLNLDSSPFIKLIDKNIATRAEILSTLQREYIEAQYLEVLELITSETGIKKYIITDVIDVLNSRIKFYLSKLGANYMCTFNTNFDFTFITTQGECEYNNFSSGELSRIDIATLFAFKDLLSNQTLATTNIMFIDEYFDSTLDDYSIESLIKLLKTEIINTNKTVYIISHRKEILEEGYQGNSFDNTIMFQKSSGISTIVKDAQAGLN